VRAIYHFSKNSRRPYIEKVVIVVTKEILRRELALKTVTISPKKVVMKVVTGTKSGDEKWLQSGDEIEANLEVFKKVVTKWLRTI